MILAEKFSQKLNNLKSKDELKDFFVFYDESRSLELTTLEGAVSKSTDPTHYSEYSEGKFIIVWNDDKVSKGIVTNTSVANFDEFINHAKKTAVEVTLPVYIPERGIYPMVRAYSKALADMIDLPEYLLKLSDISDELDRMIDAKKGSCTILVRDGTRYAHSSRSVDEYYPYTSFDLEKRFKDFFSWKVETADIYSIAKFQELFSFLGDTYNQLNQSNEKKMENGEQTIVLAPEIFRKILTEQVIDSITGENILIGKSLFTVDDFKAKLKVLGTLSISYDPLQNLKRGTYRFTDFGFKPSRQYFVKFGKLETPILGNTDYSELKYDQPTVNIGHFSNIKLEGLKKRNFTELSKSEDFIFIMDSLKTSHKKYNLSSIYAPASLYFEKGKTFTTQKLSLDINIYAAVTEGRVELVEFIDGQQGIKISGLPVKFH